MEDRGSTAAWVELEPAAPGWVIQAPRSQNSEETALWELLRSGPGDREITPVGADPASSSAARGGAIPGEDRDESPPPPGDSARSTARLARADSAAAEEPAAARGSPG